MICVANEPEFRAHLKRTHNLFYLHYIISPPRATSWELFQYFPIFQRAKAPNYELICIFQYSTYLWILNSLSCFLYEENFIIPYDDIFADIFLLSPVFCVPKP